MSAAADVFVEPELDPLQTRLVEDLRRDGIAIARFDELAEPVLWEEALRDLEPFVAQGSEVSASLGDQPGGKEEVILRRFFDRAAAKEGQLPTFELESPWVRFHASERVLDVANTYRGQLTTLHYLDNWFTVPYPDAPKRVASQRWHRDPDDSHIMKVFVYLSDVDEEAGPFEYVKGSTEGGRYGDVWAWADGHRYPPPEEFEAAIPEADRMPVTGPAGTVIFADTGGFHRGGFARTKPRLMCVSTYLPPGTERRFRIDLTGREGDLPASVRFALG